MSKKPPTRTYGEPGAVSLLRILGALAAIAGAVCFLIALLAHDSRERGAEFFIFGIGLSSGFGCYLSSLVLELLARISFDARRAADALEKQTQGAPLGGFYVLLPGDDQRGPLDEDGLRELLSSGLAVASTPAIREGNEQWRTIGEMLGDAGQ